MSYADFSTLLFALFATMYAISSVDAQKLTKMAKGVQVAFDDSSRDRKAAPRVRVLPGHESRVTPGPDALHDIRPIVARELAPELAMHRIEMSTDRRGVILSIPEAGLFALGSDEMSASAQALDGAGRFDAWREWRIRFGSKDTPTICRFTPIGSARTGTSRPRARRESSHSSSSAAASRRNGSRRPATPSSTRGSATCRRTTGPGTVESTSSFSTTPHSSRKSRRLPAHRLIGGSGGLSRVTRVRAASRAAPVPRRFDTQREASSPAFDPSRFRPPTPISCSERFDVNSRIRGEEACCT